MKNIAKKRRTSRINFLLRVRAVQATYMEHYVEGLPLTVIHRKHIYPQHFISIASLREYLTIPVQNELKKLNYYE